MSIKTFNDPCSYKIIKGLRTMCWIPVEPIFKPDDSSGQVWRNKTSEKKFTWDTFLSFSPFGKIGDVFYLNEPFKLQYLEEKEKGIHYYQLIYQLDNYKLKFISEQKLVASDFEKSNKMPFFTIRFLLESKSLGLERLHDITNNSECKPNDITAEGFQNLDEFIKFWDEIYKNTPFTWKANPWVWVWDYALNNLEQFKIKECKYAKL